MNNQLAQSIAEIDYQSWDAIMRQQAYNDCENPDKGKQFCGYARKCIQRELINLFWKQFEALN